ncbi:MAG TPA: hypothetical protein PK052_08330, partial [Anaerohalosphaeraceae bacterium]|nr:hypothetical protein [Anaerohalosphaeraceae bacterium]
MTLTDFEMDVLRWIQRPLPVCSRPFAVLAERLSATQEQVIRTIRQLQQQRLIRRIRAQIDYRALGRTASLIAAHVPAERFSEVADAVSRLPAVSHSYCRDHYYNLWFTMQAPSLIAVDAELAGLQEQLQVEFHSLPAQRLFKLDVYFEPAGPFASVSDPMPQPVQDIALSDIPRQPAELSDSERHTLHLIQQDLPVAEYAFAVLAGQDGTITEADFLAALQSLLQKGVVRKIAAVVNYPALGYAANALFCAHV